MKTNSIRVTTAFAIVGALVVSSCALAQRKKSAPDPSQSAVTVQVIGIDNHVTISYHRPGIKGRDVWTGKSDNAQIGQLIPRDGNPRPWRAGANEATTIAFEEDVTIEGKDLAAGTYALSMIPTDGDWTVVFNKDANQWGSFFYKKDQDALRVSVTPAEAPHVEWLMYGFEDLNAWGATAYLRWDTKKIAFRVESAKKG